MFVTDRSQHRIDEMLAELALLGASTRSFGFAVDVTDTERVKLLLEFVVARGGVDVLINNAGVVFGGALDDVPLTLHLQTIQVNLASLVILTAIFLPHLRTRKAAFVLNIAR